MSDATLLVGLSENNTMEAKGSIRGKDSQLSGLTSGLTRSTFALQLGRMMLTNAFPFHPDIPQMASVF